jgi:hypothetical protein
MPDLTPVLPKLPIQLIARRFPLQETDVFCRRRLVLEVSELSTGQLSGSEPAGNWPGRILGANYSAPPPHKSAASQSSSRWMGPEPDVRELAVAAFGNGVRRRSRHRTPKSSPPPSRGNPNSSGHRFRDRIFALESATSRQLLPRSLRPHCKMKT